MTADDLIARLRGRLTAEKLREALRWHNDSPRGLSETRENILDALRPECEGIEKQMALDDRQIRYLNNCVAGQVQLFEAAESSRVALRQALRDLIGEVKFHVGSVAPHKLRVALDAAEALLTHEPPAAESLLAPPQERP